MHYDRTIKVLHVRYGLKSGSLGHDMRIAHPIAKIVALLITATSPLSSDVQLIIKSGLQIRPVS